MTSTSTNQRAKKGSAKSTDARDGDKVLWVNVILQAIKDCLDLHMSGVDPSRQSMNRRQARAWFNLSNRDFLDVCHLADLDPAATYQKAVKAIADHDALVASGGTYKLPRDKVREDNAPAKLTAAPATLTYNGETLTLAEWSKRTGIKVGTINSRHNAGMSIEQVFHKGKLPFRQPLIRVVPTGRKGKTLTYNGETKTVAEWSLIIGVPLHTIGSRVRAGLPIEDVLSPKRIRGKRPELHTVDGVTLTIQQWADKIGVSADALYQRMHKGRTLAEAVAMNVSASTTTSTSTPGVGDSFPTSKETGAWSTAQEIANLEFSK